MISLAENFNFGGTTLWRKAEDGSWHAVEVEPVDPYAEAKAAFADGELQTLASNGSWVDWDTNVRPVWTGWYPFEFRRRPKPDEPTTEPSVLQEHANLIAKLDEAEGDGWWGDFGYTPASDRNGIANEAMRQAMTQKPAAPEPPKSQAPDGVFEVAPMGRNPRGWGL